MSTAHTTANRKETTSKDPQGDIELLHGIPYQPEHASVSSATISSAEGGWDAESTNVDGGESLSEQTDIAGSKSTFAAGGIPFEYDEDYDENEFIEIDLVVRAMADYERRDETELSLREGELIRVLRQDISGWWSGCKESDTGEGIVGWFPSNFVHEKHLIWGLLEEVDEEDDEAFPEDI